MAFAVRLPDSYRVSAVLDRSECSIGEAVSVSFRAKKRLRPPAVVVRYEIPLRTKDGRSIPFRGDPETEKTAARLAPRRGAYYAANDVLTVRDAFGFFAAERRFPIESGPRLTVPPEAAFVRFFPEPRTGGDAFREEPSFTRTDELSESRPYQPGDDPRRINWKMYGHSGDLFVREGDPEPPPRSRYAVLADCSADPALYSDEEGAEAVDELLARALGLVVALKEAGMEAEFGASGLPLAKGDGTSAARHFAKAVRHGLAEAPELPHPEHPGERTVVLALPRSLTAGGVPSALDRFLNARPSVASTLDLEFFDRRSAVGAGERVPPLWKKVLFAAERSRTRSRRSKESLSAAVGLCVAAYAEKAGVRARRTEG